MMEMRTKAAAGLVALAVAIGVLATPSAAEEVPVVGPTPTTFDLPDDILRIAVDPGGDRVYLATATALLVRDRDGSAVATIEVEGLSDVAATAEEIYLLTRWVPRGGQIIVLDAATLEQKRVRTWNDTDSTWSADLTTRPHLVVSDGVLWWSDRRVQSDIVCVVTPTTCRPKLWGMAVDGSSANPSASSEDTSDLVAADGVVASSTSALRKITNPGPILGPVPTGLTAISDVAAAPDGQHVVAVQASNPSTGLEVRTSDLGPTGVSYLPSSAAQAVDIAANGVVALAGASIDVFDADGGQPTTSYSLPAGTSVDIDALRFAPDGSKLYAVTADPGPGATLVVLDVAAPDLGPFGAVPAFVTQQYADALGRAATDAEQRAARAALAAGERPGAVIAPLIRAEAAANGDRAAIIRLYQAAFLRPPDRSGMEFWLRRYQSGTKLTEIAAGFAGSSEFQRRYGALANADFVRRIFENVFGRPVDPSGLAYWTARLDEGRSRGVALAQWSESSENVRKMSGLVEVVSLYLVMLDRTPTAQEFADARAALANGTTLADGADGMLRSPAYATRITTS